MYLFNIIYYVCILKTTYLIDQRPPRTGLYTYTSWIYYYNNMCARTDATTYCVVAAALGPRSPSRPSPPRCHVYGRPEAATAVLRSVAIDDDAEDERFLLQSDARNTTWVQSDPPLPRICLDAITLIVRCMIFWRIVTHYDNKICTWIPNQKNIY